MTRGILYTWSIRSRGWRLLRVRVGDKGGIAGDNWGYNHCRVAGTNIKGTILSGIIRCNNSQSIIPIRGTNIKWYNSQRYNSKGYKPHSIFAAGLSTPMALRMVAPSFVTCMVSFLLPD